MTKSKNCKKGYSCGASCISRKRNCLQAAKGKGRTYAEYLKANSTSVGDESKPQQTSSSTNQPKSNKSSRKANFSLIPTPTRKNEIRKLEKELLAVEKEARRLYDSDKELYGDNYGIVQSTRIEAAMDIERFRGVRDEKGNIQAMASVHEQDGAIKVEYLATSPWNVKPGDDRYTRGGGSAMMEQIALEAVRSGNLPIKLEALPGAIGFYEKIGFNNLGQAEDYNDGVVNMTLSPEKAREFLKRRGIIEFKEQTDEEWNAELEDLEMEANGAFAGGKRKKAN